MAVAIYRETLEELLHILYLTSKLNYDISKRKISQIINLVSSSWSAFEALSCQWSHFITRKVINILQISVSDRQQYSNTSLDTNHEKYLIMKNWQAIWLSLISTIWEPLPFLSQHDDIVNCLVSNNKPVSLVWWYFNRVDFDLSFFGSWNLPV